MCGSSNSTYHFSHAAPNVSLHLSIPCSSILSRYLSFLSNNLKNLLAAYLCDGSLCVVELPETDEWDRFEGNEIGVENCSLDFKPDNLLHLSWLDTHTLLGVSRFSLQEIEVACSENSLPGGVCLSGWHAK